MRAFIKKFDLSSISKYLVRYKFLLADPRFWIFVFFIIRLETIDLPPLDAHSWRQCFTLGVARNYSEVDATFWEPKTVIWYWVWVPWAENTYQFRLFFPTTLSEGYYQLISDLNDLGKRFYPTALTSKISFFFCILGFVLALVKKQLKMILLFILSTVILIFFMLKTGRVFSGHDYYIIPYVPMMSLLAGYAISFLYKWEYLYYVTLIIISIEAIAYHKKDFFINGDNKKYLKLESITEKFVKKSERILVNSGEGQPWMMYLAKRRGWAVTDRMKDTSWVNGEYTVGLKYLLIDKAKYQDTIPCPVLFDDFDFRLYKVIKD